MFTERCPGQRWLWSIWIMIDSFLHLPSPGCGQVCVRETACRWAPCGADVRRLLIVLLCQPCVVLLSSETDGAEKQEAGFPVHWRRGAAGSTQCCRRLRGRQCPLIDNRGKHLLVCVVSGISWHTIDIPPSPPNGNCLINTDNKHYKTATLRTNNSLFIWPAEHMILLLPHCAAQSPALCFSAL